jgi:hypothetical protein
MIEDEHGAGTIADLIEVGVDVPARFENDPLVIPGRQLVKQLAGSAIDANSAIRSGGFDPAHAVIRTNAFRKDDRVQRPPAAECLGDGIAAVEDLAIGGNAAAFPVAGIARGAAALPRLPT